MHNPKVAGSSPVSATQKKASFRKFGTGLFVLGIFTNDCLSTLSNDPCTTFIGRAPYANYAALSGLFWVLIVIHGIVRILYPIYEKFRFLHLALKGRYQ
jgi:hypothetical protein